MDILNLFINFLQSSIMVYFINKTVIKKNNYTKVYPFIFIFILTSFISLVNQFIIHESVLGLSLIGLMFLYTHCISKDSLIKQAIVSVYPYALIGMISTLVYLFGSLLIVRSIDFRLIASQYLVTVNISATVLFFIAMHFSIRLFRLSIFDLKKSDSIYVIILLILINFLHLFFESIFFTRTVNDILLVISYLSMIASLILLFYIVNRMNINSQELYKQKLDYAILNSELTYNDKVVTLEKEIYQMKHDIKHLLELENSNALFPKELFANYDKAIEQISYYISTSNRVLNYVLKMKNEECTNRDINFSCSCNLIRTLRINDVDLYLLLMNILDNAIENCSNSKQINFKISCDETTLFIKAINSTRPCLPSMKQTISSTKNEDGHGFGLETMNKIASKYNGSIFIAQKTNEFIVDIELRD